MNPLPFADFCRKERQRRNMTLADQSELMKIPPLKISQIESGEEKLFPEYLQRVCSFFQISEDKKDELLTKCSETSNIILFRPQKLKLYQLTINEIKALRSNKEQKYEV